MILRSVDSLRCQCNVASSQGDKNQYPDTLPYDHTRVVLSKTQVAPNIVDENSHYINASYVPVSLHTISLQASDYLRKFKSWFREKSYVVTQSVKTKPAAADFWRMIWELGANTIVMLTKVFDFMRVMCMQYWHTTKFNFGQIEVETIETKTYAHFVSPSTILLPPLNMQIFQGDKDFKNPAFGWGGRANRQTFSFHRMGAQFIPVYFGLH